MLVLNIFGRKMAGKNTLAGLLAKYLGPTQEVSFAAPLKDAARIMFSQYWAGLDENSSQDKEKNLFQLPVTPEAAKTFPLVAGKPYWNMRLLWQVFGTEIGRAIKPEIWLDLGENTARLHLAQGKIVLFTDCRFPNEYERLNIAFYGKIVNIQVLREAVTCEASHASEKYVDNFKSDIIVDNNESLEDLDKAAQRLAKQLAPP